MELPDELGDQIGMHQIMLEGVDDQSLENSASDALAVFAGAAAARDATSEIVLASCCERAATLTAAGETCQQMLGTAVKPEFFLAGFPHSVTAPDTGESLLHAVPEIVFDDP